MLFRGKDLSRMLREWNYDSSKLNVRRIIGEDGREKIQLRVDLGILQMEVDGRPDGRRPHGRESLLDHYLGALKAHRKDRGSVTGFVLSKDDCLDLQQEAVQYYHRYLSLFYLGDFEGVVRDTKRNLKAFDLVKKYADDASDRQIFEQFRPFVLMMHTRAKASMALKEKEFDQAISLINQGINDIENCSIEDSERGPGGDVGSEVIFLQRWKDEVSKLKPEEPLEKLQREMDEAVHSENFELAAELRDKLRIIQRLDLPEP